MSKKTRKKTSNKAPKKSTTPKPSPKARASVSKVSAKRPTSKAAKSAVAKSKNPGNGQTNARGASTKVAKSSASTSNRKTAAHSTLAEGAKAPSFHLPRDGGDSVSLADFAGQKLVLFFYPRADTPGCTREAIDFTRLHDAFAAAGTAVVGVSGDAPKKQEAFRNKHKLTVPLASDEQHDMLEAYGAWGEKSMYGKMFEGVLRTTVLIGADGKVIKVWRSVKVDGHADEVLVAAKTA